MKSVSSLILSLLLLFSITSRAQGRNLTLYYFPPSTDTAPLTFAFSPDATDSAPGGNPTLSVPPNTVLTIPLNEGNRIWWYTPGGGWEWGPASTDPGISNNVQVFVQDSGATSRFAYFDPVPAAPGGGGATVDPDKMFGLLAAGFGLCVVPLTIVALLRSVKRGVELGGSAQ